MSSLPIDEIIIDRPARQRRILIDIEELAASIARSGLIHPPVVTRERVLVAGERRIAATRSLGWSSIPVTFTDELAPEVLHLIELEENICRAGLPWQDEAKAVAEYHRLRSVEPEWTAIRTAKALGRSEAQTSTLISLAGEIAAGNTLVRDAQNRSVAINMMQRIKERRKASALEAIGKTEPKDETASSVLQSSVELAPSVQLSKNDAVLQARSISPIIHADFHEWASTYTGPPFNFFHCDFPYGINADKRQQGTSVYKHGGYADSPDVYWKLLTTLAEAMPALATPSAHMMFWFSMDYYTETLGFFARHLPDWNFQPFPLYWSKSDNVGLLPDPKRGPRRVVETALVGSRGDRLLVQAVSNHFAHPTERRAGHISVKPEPVLRHFFRMFCDDNTSMLDPTCGLGSSLRAARASGASRICGVEQNSDFAALARDLWEGKESSDD